MHSCGDECNVKAEKGLEIASLAAEWKRSKMGGRELHCWAVASRAEGHSIHCWADVHSLHCWAEALKAEVEVLRREAEVSITGVKGIVE